MSEKACELTRDKVDELLELSGETRETVCFIEVPKIYEIIREYAFANCSNLQRVQLPDGITFIGKYAFSSCESLERINFPEELVCIDNGAFMGCLNLKRVKFPANLKIIGESAFRNCHSLKKVLIPKSLVAIEDYAFCHCRGIRKVRFEKGSELKELGFMAFGQIRRLWYFPERAFPKQFKGNFRRWDAFIDSSARINFFREPVRKIRFRFKMYDLLY